MPASLYWILTSVGSWDEGLSGRVLRFLKPVHGQGLRGGRGQEAEGCVSDVTRPRAGKAICLEQSGQGSVSEG